MPDQQTWEPARPHVSAEQVADLLESLLPGAEAAAVAAHLDDCTDCARLRDDLLALPALLAASPTPPMPADVAARLDAAVAEAATERDERVSRPATVTSLDSRRRRFVTRTFAGVAAAAAVVVGFVVVGDVLAPTGSDDSSVADSASEAGGSGDASSPQAAGEDEMNGLRLAELDSADFDAADEALAGAYLAARGDALLESDSEERKRSITSLTDGGACLAADLRRGDVTGRYGPLVLLDGKPVTLVASGPRRHTLVIAYSCASGEPQEQNRAFVDLRR